MDATEQDAATIDEQLLREIAAGSQDAFRQLHERHAAVLLSFCAARVGRTQADDVVQAVWLRLWPYFQNGNYHGQKFRPLLFTTARNIITDEWRRSRVVGSASDGLDQFADPADDAAAVRVVEAERMKRLAECLEKLQAAHADRAAVAVRKLAAVDVAEISVELGVNRDRVDKLWFEARSFLSDCVGRGDS